MSASSCSSIDERQPVLNEALIRPSSYTDHSLGRDGLLDALIALYDECNRKGNQGNKYVVSFINKYRSTIAEFKALQVGVSDFEFKDVIGRGHFGEVQVVREKATGKVFAMKVLRKSETLLQPDISFVEEERDIMAMANSLWITQLAYAFQDAHSLYLVMEFHPGGDLLSLLARYDDVFPEDMAKFYLAEMSVAIHDLHSMGYIHRDIKPENVLIDKSGHIKLADFGSAARLSNNKQVTSRMPVGTPDYVSPELLLSMNCSDSPRTYGIEVDWWSLGICMYEMLYGKTPFTDEKGSMVTTYSNIMKYESVLTCSNDKNTSARAIDLIKHLLSDKDSRYDYQEISSHCFFDDMPLNKVRNCQPPFIPVINGMDDTSNFDEFEKVRYQPTVDQYKSQNEFTGRDLPFIGFTFVKEHASSLKINKSLHNDAVQANLTSGLEVKLTVTTEELQSVNENCFTLEKAKMSLKADLEQLQKKYKNNKDELQVMDMEKIQLEKDLQSYISKYNTRGSYLKKEIVERREIDDKAALLLTENISMMMEAKVIEDEINRNQLEDLHDVICYMESEYDNLLKQLLRKQRQAEKSTEQLESTRKKVTELQTKIDKERRKSRDGVFRDIAVMENREEVWKSQLEEKVKQIDKLNKSMEELEISIERYQSEIKELGSKGDELRVKLNRRDKEAVVLETNNKNYEQQVSTANDRFVELVGKLDAEKRERQILETKVKSFEQQTKLSSEREDKLNARLDTFRKDNRELKCNLEEQISLNKQTTRSKNATIEKLKDLEEENSQRLANERELRKSEREVKNKCQEMEDELGSFKRRERISSRAKETLLEQVQNYQSEVIQQRNKMKDLQESVQSCIAQEDQVKGKVPLLEQKIKDLEDQMSIQREGKLSYLRDSRKYQKESEEKERQNLEHEGNISLLNVKVQQMEAQLAEMRDCEKDRLTKKDRDNTRGKIAEDKLNDLQQEKVYLETKISTLETRMMHFRRNSESSQTLVSDLQQKLQAKTEEQSKLLEDLQRKYDESQLSLSETKSRLASMEGREKRAKDQLEKAQTEARELNLKIQTSEVSNGEEADKLESMLKDKEWKVKQLEDEVKLTKSQHAILTRQYKEMEDRLQEYQTEKSRLCDIVVEKSSEQGQIVDSLRRQLDESKLALSEARMQSASMQQRERSLKDQLEKSQNEARELQYKMQTTAMSKHNEVDHIENSLKATDMACKQLEDELRLTMSQNEKLSRVYKDLEDKVSNFQREKSKLSMEKQTVIDELSAMRHQCEMEAGKVQQLKTVCLELEQQVKDLEALNVQYEKSSTEWNSAKSTYEKVVDEREEEIEGKEHLIQTEQHLRQAANDKVGYYKQQIKAINASHQKEIESLMKQLRLGKDDLKKKTEKMYDTEQDNTKMNQILTSLKTGIHGEVKSNRDLKEEISNYITVNQELREENLKYKRNLSEVRDKFELIFGEKIDLENVMESVQGLHFYDKFRFEIQQEQQMKLIDYLQAKAETVSKKKKGSVKLFPSTSWGKDSPSPLPPMPYKDLQLALEQEKKRFSRLHEQMERLREENYQQATELLHLKGPLLDKVPLETEFTPQRIDRLSTRRSPRDKISPHNLLTPSMSWRSSPMLTTPQRMNHSIPHRFVSGLNSRATKCCVCLGTVHFVKQAAKCQECEIVCHPKCMRSVADTCGLPSEYLQNFTNAVDKLKSAPLSPYSPCIQDKTICMDGWLKLQRPGKPGWDKKWVDLEGSLLMMYNQNTDANPIDTFDLCPEGAEVTVHGGVTEAELSMTAHTDLPFVLRLELEPLTSCWPGRTLYLMALNFKDKQKWVATLEAVTQSRTGEKKKKEKLLLSTVMELRGDKKLEVNCALVLSKQLLLLGADEGLYTVDLQNPSDTSTMIKLSGVDHVQQLAYCPSLGLVLMISGSDREIFMVEKKFIKTRVTQGQPESMNLPVRPVESVDACTVFDVGVWGGATYMCVGMPDKVVLMKYNAKLAMFCIRKEYAMSEPCSCICVTENMAIVGTNKFFKIDMEHSVITEFVDKRDNSLAFAAFGAASHNSFPLAVVCVSPAGQPMEFLLCFHEFGVYVNSKGIRSRPANMKWSGLPLAFSCRDQFLYVMYFNCIQAIVIPGNKAESRGIHSTKDLSAPRYLGPAAIAGAVYFASVGDTSCELVCALGDNGLLVSEDKENRCSRTDKPQVRFTSPGQPIEYTPQKRSNSSLESASSTTTSESSEPNFRRTDIFMSTEY